MSTSEIANSLLGLQRSTLQEMLEHVGILVGCCEEHVMGKSSLVKMFEDAIIDIGLEYLLAKCNSDIILHLSQELSVPAYRKCIADKIRHITIPTFLQQVDDNTLETLSEALGLFKSPNRYSAIAEISEEMIYCGIREIIGKLFSTHILNKLCLEFRLIDAKPREKQYLVYRLLCKLDA